LNDMHALSPQVLIERKKRREYWRIEEREKTSFWTITGVIIPTYLSDFNLFSLSSLISICVTYWHFFFSFILWWCFDEHSTQKIVETQQDKEKQSTTTITVESTFEVSNESIA
jgi:hypothetical protein